MKRLAALAGLCFAASTFGQQFPPPYNSTTTYPGASLVAASNGCIYRAIHSTVGHDPTTDGHVYWELSLARTSLVLRVASAGAVFKSIKAAWAFLANASISGTNTVQISVAPPTGVYKESFTTELSVNHPFRS